MASTSFKGSPADLAGNEVNVGDLAPEVSLVGADLGEVKVGGKQDKKQVIVVVPSLDTGVCAAEARAFNQKASSLDGAKVVVVSQDLPFAMGRFCTTEGIENLQVGSDFVNKEFANKYGVLLANTPLKGLTCRAVFVVDTEGKISYKQIVPEITQEPDYEDVLANI